MTKKYIEMSESEKKYKQALNTRRRTLQRAYESQYEGKFSMKNPHQVKAAEKIIEDRKKYYNQKPVKTTSKPSTSTTSKPSTSNTPKPTPKTTPNSIASILSNSTQQKSRVNVVLKEMNKNINTSTINDLLDTNRVESIINNKYELSKRHNYYGALVLLFSKVQHLYPRQYKAYIDYVRINNYYKNYKLAKELEGKTLQELTGRVKTLTNREKENWFDYNKLIDLMNNQPEFSDMLYELLAALYIYLPVERSEYRTLQLTHKEPDPNDTYQDSQGATRKRNWVVMDGETPVKIVLYEFKTKQNYKQIIINLNNFTEVQTILSEYITTNDIHEGEYLFPDRVRKYFTNYVMKATRELTGKAIDQKTLRRIYVTHLYTKPRTADQIIEDALQIGHGVDVELKEYIRNK